MGHGKICYVELPAEDVQRSAQFYSEIFGWKIRTRGDGSTAFDDGVGQVSGSFISGRPPQNEGGLVMYIMVDDINDTIAKIEDAGTTISKPVDLNRSEVFAHFHDPGGNLLGIYQHRVAG